MKRTIFAVIAVLAISSSAWAGGYKSAGCGLGSMIIKDDGFVQVFAATTNATSDSQTFGITSGTSNCGGSGGYAKLDVEKQMYVEANHDAIAQEAVQGSGEHLNALATLMGCDKSADPLFSADMKKNYRSISSVSDADQVLTNVKATISNDPQLSKACSG